jgi:ribosomal protein L15E
MPVIPATQGSTVRRATVQAGPGTKQDPNLKKKKPKRLAL